MVTVHAEAGPHLDRSVQLIRSLGMKAGVALTPSTPESALRYVLNKLHRVLEMTVNPGFGGQSFIPEQVHKIRAIKQMIGDRPIHLEVDGGIHLQTALLVAQLAQMLSSQGRASSTAATTQPMSRRCATQPCRRALHEQSAFHPKGTWIAKHIS
jgi:ribulose-phosphate 3-epimerase